MLFQRFQKLQVEPLAEETTIKQNMGLYKSPRVRMVAKFLQEYGEKRPMPVADVLPVILMNYGEVKFQEAQTWCEDVTSEYSTFVQEDRKGVTDVISGSPLSR